MAENRTVQFLIERPPCGVTWPSEILAMLPFCAWIEVEPTTLRPSDLSCCDGKHYWMIPPFVVTTADGIELDIESKVTGEGYDVNSEDWPAACEHMGHIIE